MAATKIKSGRLDAIVSWLVLTFIVLSAAMLIAAYYRGEPLGLWIWERHQNQFSWYSRPLFIIPACYYAFRQNLWLCAGFMLLMLCSLFWFEAPESVSGHVVNYLEWEKQLFFANESVLPLLFLLVGVIAFLFVLFYAFWQRNPWMGLLVINTGTLLKIAVSIVFGKEAGLAAIVPSVSSLVVINLVAYVVWRRFAGRQSAC